jgi:acetylornithine deacetylase/succinyl-diaminopimelate desuccinylase-like protein
VNQEQSTHYQQDNDDEPKDSAATRVRSRCINWCRFSHTCAMKIPFIAGLVCALSLTCPTLSLASGGPADLPPGPQPPEATKALARELLKGLIEINSTHSFGSTMAAEWVAARLQTAGFPSEDLKLIAPPGQPEKGNLVMRLHGRGEGKPLLFISHLDVVEARKEDWSVDPFVLTEQDGYLYGRGTYDIKGDDAALGASLLRLKTEGFIPDRDIVVALTADEETFGEFDGVDWLLRNHRDLIDAGLILNPDAGGGTSSGNRRLYMGLETSEKSYVTFGLEVTNKGGHSSLPEPDNAIYRLAEGLGRIARLDFPVRLSPTTRAYFAALSRTESGQMSRDLMTIAATTGHFDRSAVRRLEGSIFYNAMLHTTCVATMLSGGHAENALPQRAGATIQCRMLPDDSQANVQAELAKALADPAIRISVISPALPGPESVVTPVLKHKFEDVVGSMWPGVPVVPDMDAGASDSKFTRAAGIPTFGLTGIFTDIDDNRAHGKDERIAVSGFYEDVEFTYRLMKAFSTGD